MKSLKKIKDKNDFLVEKQELQPQWAPAMNYDNMIQ